MPRRGVAHIFVKVRPDGEQTLDSGSYVDCGHDGTFLVGPHSPYKRGKVYFVKMGGKPASIDEGGMQNLILSNYGCHFYGPEDWTEEELRAAAYHYLSEHVWKNSFVAIDL